MGFASSPSSRFCRRDIFHRTDQCHGSRRQRPTRLISMTCHEALALTWRSAKRHCSEWLSVVNEAGGPLAGLEVSWAELVISPHSRDQLLGLRKVTTDKNGKFHLGHAPPKHLYFLVQTPGYAPTVAELDPKQPESEKSNCVWPKAENLLAKSRIIRATTSWTRIFHLQISASGARCIGEAVTDSRGRFNWNDAPAEKFQLQIEKDGYITQQKIVQAVDGK